MNGFDENFNYNPMDRFFGAIAKRKNTLPRSEDIFSLTTSGVPAEGWWFRNFSVKGASKIVVAVASPAVRSVELQLFRNEIPRRGGTSRQQLDLQLVAPYNATENRATGSVTFDCVGEELTLCLRNLDTSSARIFDVTVIAIY